MEAVRLSLCTCSFMLVITFDVTVRSILSASFLLFKDSVELV